MDEECVNVQYLCRLEGSADNKDHEEESSQMWQFKAVTNNVNRVHVTPPVTLAEDPSCPIHVIRQPKITYISYLKLSQSYNI